MLRMKKVLKIIGTIVLVIIIMFAILVMYRLGLFDTRFWTYDRNVYSEFYNGMYVAGKDLEPGSYAVEIKGGSMDTGTIKIQENMESNDEEVIWVHTGDRGFQFTLEEGQVLKTNLGSEREMRIKKVK